MKNDLKKIEKLYGTLQQSIKDARVLKKSTKKTDVIFLGVLDSHEETCGLLLKLLNVRKELIGVYGK